MVTGLTDESKQIRAFQSCTAPADQNDQTTVRRFLREGEKIVPVTSYHHAPILLGGGEDEFIRGISRQRISHPRDFVTMPRKGIFDRGGNVVVEEKLHFSACSI